MPSGQANNTGTTNYSGDTIGIFLGGDPFGDWTTVMSGWTVIGLGVAGTILSIDLITDQQYTDRRSVSIVLAAGGGSFQSGGNYTVSPPKVACFVEGTRIMTDSGYKTIETLITSDRVLTADNRTVAFKLHRKTIIGSSTTAPYCIAAGALGKFPVVPLRLSPTHKILIRKGVWNSADHLARTNAKVRQYGIGDPVTYYHIETDDFFRDNIVAEGAVVESFGTQKSIRGKRNIYKWNDRLQGFTRLSGAAESLSLTV